ncbi:MAG: hypothetical protein ACE5DZ_09665 [Mariprofundus sp.]
MRAVALIAIVGLQLSILTCGYDSHVHHMDGESGAIEHHHDPAGGDGGLSDHPCQVHASHVFIDHEPNILNAIPSAPESSYELATLNFTSVPHLIERPPKHSHG